MVRVMDWKTSAWCLGPQRKANFLVQQCSAKDHIAVGKALNLSPIDDLRRRPCPRSGPICRLRPAPWSTQCSKRRWHDPAVPSRASRWTGHRRSSRGRRAPAPAPVAPPGRQRWSNPRWSAGWRFQSPPPHLSLAEMILDDLGLGDSLQLQLGILEKMNTTL